MALNITRSDIDKLREMVKKYEPFALDDPVLNETDGNADINRIKATHALMALNELGIDPYDENDYGDLKE
jgi:hypothetical protein